MVPLAVNTGPADTDSSARLPLYRQVQARITHALSSGQWKPGEAIPSETQLARRYRVSVGTIRKAVDELAAGNILVRQQGRGTFVATHSEDRRQFHFFHIVRKDAPRELPVHEMLSFHRAKASVDESRQLAIARGAPVMRMQNLLRLGGSPVIFDEISVRADLFPGLDQNTYAQRDGTIYGLYQAHSRINVIRISERLSAAAAPAMVASLVGLPPQSPMLVIKRLAYTYADVPVEYRISWVNSRDHQYLSDLWKGETLR